MMIILLMSIIFLTITFLMMTISSILSMKSSMDREKNSPFECGFDPKSSARMPFSLHFFLIAVIFLIFDVEITLLIPMIFNLNMSSPMNYLIFWFFFLFILLSGLYHEWHQSALEWPS